MSGAGTAQQKPPALDQTADLLDVTILTGHSH